MLIIIFIVSQIYPAVNGKCKKTPHLREGKSGAARIDTLTYKEANSPSGASRRLLLRMGACSPPQMLIFFEKLRLGLEKADTMY